MSRKEVIENLLGPIYTDEMVPGQVPIAALKYFLESGQEFVVTGRVHDFDYFDNGHLVLSDGTGKLLLNSENLTSFSEIFSAIHIGDIITARVHSVKIDDQVEPRVLIDELRVVALCEWPQVEQQIVTVFPPDTDYLMLKSVVQKQIRMFFDKQGFMEVDGKRDQRKSNLKILLKGLPNIFAIHSNILYAHAMHRDYQDMQKLLVLLLNSIQFCLDKRIWPSEFEVESSENIEKWKKPDYISFVENDTENTYFRFQDKYANVFKNKRELFLANDSIAIVGTGITNPADYKRPGDEYHHLLKYGCPPYGMFALDLSVFVRELQK